jgi:group II intron reverse transcriptase/maturase
MDWMKEAYRLTRKDGAPGIDGVTAAIYEANLEANLRDLLDRIKSGRYHAPPVRRAYIPKADGTQRPLGIPTFEDKVAQRAVTMVLEAIYEQDFLPCSYGFRPGRSAHQALHTLRDAIWGQRLYWVLDVDIRKYFDSIPHSHLRSFLDQRVTDGVIRRMIDKWLKAGVVEDGLLHHTTAGSPQGGVISPCLSNVYLHYVLDEWFETEVRPRLKGRCTLVRYADDLVMAFEHCEDAKRVLAVLGKRLERYGLMLHPDKTRFVDFRPNRPDRTDHPATDGTSFDFLGFTHVWGKSRNGKNMVRQVTAKSRFARAMAAVTEWCRVNRHQPIPVQHARLAAMMRGHYAYYGIGGNGRRLRWYARQVVRTWKKWLSRRGRHGNVLWSRLTELLKHHPLPPPRIVRPYATASESLS